MTWIIPCQKSKGLLCFVIIHIKNVRKSCLGSLYKPRFAQVLGGQPGSSQQDQH